MYDIVNLHVVQYVPMMIQTHTCTSYLVPHIPKMEGKKRAPVEGFFAQASFRPCPSLLRNTERRGITCVFFASCDDQYKRHLLFYWVSESCLVCLSKEVNMYLLRKVDNEFTASHSRWATRKRHCLLPKIHFSYSKHPSKNSVLRQNPT